MLKAIALNCSLKTDDKPSSTDSMINLVARCLREHDVELIDTIRVARHDVKPGVSSDEGDGDAWPRIRARVLEADILILGTPIWMGQPSSVCKRVLERMDAFLGETDDRERMPSYSKIAVVAVVGNEDGAHHVSAELYQALADTGWTIPAGGTCYWVGEAMHGTDFQDLDEIPEPVMKTAKTLASNSAHLARLLKLNSYPGIAG
ncbi:flavodoxin family protein [Lysobacter korlensis]|uniref:Flavodoxin family protein n=1 Tax=Lysobacter korlensis TaxID=553636 RepID=A0ABV6RK28_9GAMM